MQVFKHLQRNHGMSFQLMSYISVYAETQNCLIEDENVGVDIATARQMLNVAIAFFEWYSRENK